MAKQYRSYGFVSRSMLFVTLVQSYYVLEGQYNEAGFLTMRDIATDGLGFMLTFGDLVWVPFLYSAQCRYLSVYPTPLDSVQIVIMGVCFIIGLYIFRAANSEKILSYTSKMIPAWLICHISRRNEEQGYLQPVGGACLAISITSAIGYKLFRSALRQGSQDI